MPAELVYPITWKCENVNINKLEWDKYMQKVFAFNFWDKSKIIKEKIGEPFSMSNKIRMTNLKKLCPFSQITLTFS